MFERLVRTLAVVANVAFASPARRGEVLGLLAKTHEKVRGRTPGGAPYSAGDADLVTWVHATLIDSAMAVNRRWLAELDPSETEDFYSESLRLGSAFGVPEGALPDQLSRFEEWMAENVTLLEVGDQARDIAAHLLRPPLSQAWGPLGGAASPLAHHCLESITADLLPTPLRDAYALKTHGRTECAAWSALSRTSRSRRRITAGARPDAPTRLAARLARLGLEQG